MSFRTVRVCVSVSTGFVGSKIEDVISVEIPEDYSKEQEYELITSEVDDWIWETIRCGWAYEDLEGP